MKAFYKGRTKVANPVAKRTYPFGAEVAGEVNFPLGPGPRMEKVT
jgi:hypothetical protein